MAALTLQPHSAIFRPLQIEAWTMAPQGSEDKQLREAAGAALRHWQHRSEYLLGVQDNSQDYISVPLEKALTVQVKYRYVGEMKPRFFPLDE
jgi:hypothetical protein